MRAKFLDGSIQVTANDWPNFLYEEDVYDPDELDKGLLQGYFLLRVCPFSPCFSLAKCMIRYTGTSSLHPPLHLRKHLDQMRRALETLSYTKWSK